MVRRTLVVALSPGQRDAVADAIAFYLGEDPRVARQDRRILERLLDEVFDAEHAENPEASRSRA